MTVEMAAAIQNINVKIQLKKMNSSIWKDKGLGRILFTLQNHESQWCAGKCLTTILQKNTHANKQLEMLPI